MDANTKFKAEPVSLLDFTFDEIELLEELDLERLAVEASATDRILAAEYGCDWLRN